MSLIEDARRLAEQERSDYCGDPRCPRLADRAQSHRTDCPYLALPRIVAALEAAERLAAQNGKLSDGRIGSCPVCGGGAMAGHPIFDQAHHTNCPMKALVAALRGEGVKA